MIKRLTIYFAFFLFLLLIIFFVADYAVFSHTVKVNRPYFDDLRYKPFLKEKFNIDKWYERQSFRPTEGEKYNKSGIILFGCGFVYGIGSNENQTFSAVLSKYTKRPVYNRGIGGGGVTQALLMTQSGKIDDEIKNSKYAVITHPTLDDFIARLYIYPGVKTDGFVLEEYDWPHYTEKNGKLIFHENILPFFECSHVSKFAKKLLITYLLEHKNNLVIKIMSDNFNLHLRTLKDSLQKINPNIQVVVLNYSYDNQGDYKQIFKNLEKDGLIVLHIDSLSEDDMYSDKYNCCKDNFHPSEAAWNKLVPEISKQLNL